MFAKFATTFNVFAAVPERKNYYNVNQLSIDDRFRIHTNTQTHTRARSRIHIHINACYISIIISMYMYQAYAFRVLKYYPIHSNTTCLLNPLNIDRMHQTLIVMFMEWLLFCILLLLSCLFFVFFLSHSRCTLVLSGVSRLVSLVSLSVYTRDSEFWPIHSHSFTNAHAHTYTHAHALVYIYICISIDGLRTKVCSEH